MRLIVQVLPLSKGPANSLAAHSRIPITPRKADRFTLPVKPEQTFEQIWILVEERYKRNYLTPAQAANFMIKKIQDGYNCDLDLSDTVGAIFEGEKDQEKIMIQVIQAPIDRDVSVPVTSNLRPANAHKRLLEIQKSSGNKRRRIEEQRYGAPIEDLHPDRPVHSRERDTVARHFEVSNEERHENHARHRGSGFGSGSSVIVVEDSQPGVENDSNPSFEEPPKSESPELEGQSVQRIPESSAQYHSSPLLGVSDTVPTNAPITFIKPSLPASRLRAHQSTVIHQKTPVDTQSAPITEHAEREDSQDAGGEEDVDDAMDIGYSSQDVTEQLRPRFFGEPQLPSNPYSSNATTPEYLERPTSPDFGTLHARRVDVYDEIESPEEEEGIINRRAKRLKTYGRHPRTPKMRQTKAHSTYTPQSPPISAHKSNTTTPSLANSERAPDNLMRPSLEDQANPPVSTPMSKTVENTRSGSPMHATKLLHIMRERRRSRGENLDLDQSPKATYSEVIGNSMALNGDSQNRKDVQGSSTLKKPLKRSYKMPSPNHPFKSQNAEEHVPLKDNPNTQHSESPKLATNRKTKSPSAEKQREHDEKRKAKEKEKELADKRREACISRQILANKSRKTEAALAEHFTQKEANEAERKSSERELRLRESEERRKLREETSFGSQENTQISVTEQTPALRKTRSRSSAGSEANSTKKGQATRSQKLTNTPAAKTRVTPSRKAGEESNEKQRQRKASESTEAAPLANSRPRSNAAATSPLMGSDEVQARMAKIEELTKRITHRKTKEAQATPNPSSTGKPARPVRKKDIKENSIPLSFTSNQPSERSNMVTPVKDASLVLSDRAPSVQSSARCSVSFSTELESSEKKDQTRFANILKATSPTGILKKPAGKAGRQPSNIKANNTPKDAPKAAPTESRHPVGQRAEVPLPGSENYAPEVTRNMSRAKATSQEKAYPSSQRPDPHSEELQRLGKRKFISPTHDVKNTIPPSRKRSETPSRLGRKTITPNITPAMRQTLLGFPRDKGKAKLIQSSPPRPAPSEDAIAISSDSDESEPEEPNPGPSMTVKEKRTREAQRRASAETGRAQQADTFPTFKGGAKGKVGRTTSRDQTQPNGHEASPTEKLEGAQNGEGDPPRIENASTSVNVDQAQFSDSVAEQDRPIIIAQDEDGHEGVSFDQTSVPTKSNTLEHKQSSEERQISEEVEAAQKRHASEQRQVSREGSESSGSDESGSDDLDEIETPKPVDLEEAVDKTKLPKKASPQADQSDSDSDSDSDSNERKGSPEASPLSPSTIRAPARYVSHTPSEGSTSDDDASPEKSPSPGQAQDAQKVTTKLQEPSNKDIEMEDADPAPPSSPPELHVEEKYASPTPSTSSDSSQESSQSLPQAPGFTKPSSPPAAPSSAAGRPSASARSTKSRPVLSKFPTLKQQLEQVRATPAKQALPKTLNPGTIRLNGVNGASDSDSDESSDDSSSSSSSDDDDNEGKAKPGSLLSSMSRLFRRS